MNPSPTGGCVPRNSHSQNVGAGGVPSLLRHARRSGTWPLEEGYVIIPRLRRVGCAGADVAWCVRSPTG